MKISFTILLLFVSSWMLSQDNTQLLIDAKEKLSKGENTKAYLMLKKLNQTSANDAATNAYLSYSSFKMCYHKDSINPTDVASIKDFASNALKLDSSLAITRIAYGYSLLVEYKTLSGRKEKCENLFEIKRQLNALNDTKESSAELNNLYAIWHRTVGGMSEFEKEASKTFYHMDLSDGKIEKALDYHKKAIALNKENASLLYEQILTYQAMGSFELETMTVDKLLRSKNKSEETRLYQKLATN